MTSRSAGAARPSSSSRLYGDPLIPPLPVLSRRQPRTSNTLLASCGRAEANTFPATASTVGTAAEASRRRSNCSSPGSSSASSFAPASACRRKPSRSVGSSASVPSASMFSSHHAWEMSSSNLTTRPDLGLWRPAPRGRTPVPAREPPMKIGTPLPVPATGAARGQQRVQHRASPPPVGRHRGYNALAWASVRECLSNEMTEIGALLGEGPRRHGRRVVVVVISTHVDTSCSPQRDPGHRAAGLTSASFGQEVGT